MTTIGSQSRLYSNGCQKPRRFSVPHRRCLSSLTKKFEGTRFRGRTLYGGDVARCWRSLRCIAQDDQVASGVDFASSETTRSSSSASSVPKTDAWELDFSSRPMFDERGKKVWEVVFCDADRSFEYTKYLPNNKINSGELRRTVEEVLLQEGAVKPRVVRFFRGQMSTIITRALSDLEIKPIPSRRCFTIMGWLEERLEDVYKKDPRYSEKAQNLFMLDLGAPTELDDALRGEAWNFVQLPLGTLVEELKDVESGDIFGCGLPLDRAGLGDLPMDTLVPGISVYSRRAEPLAAWTNGLEISNIKADIDRAGLVMETGVNETWKYAAYERTDDMSTLATGWEQAKVATRGLHFLAIQDDPDAEYCAGLWLLQERTAKI
ncbi:hypothetical protein BSKO_03509 [Bryopsis sp. KO-2023]|nr:hypothetical protein BSKO_03509 [Bryopsis sp. KO-2023]